MNLFENRKIFADSPLRRISMVNTFIVIPFNSLISVYLLDWIENKWIAFPIKIAAAIIFLILICAPGWRLLVLWRFYPKNPE